MEKNQTFYINLSQDNWVKNDILKPSPQSQLKIVEVCELSRWQKFIKWLGFGVTYRYKVEVIDKSKFQEDGNQKKNN